MSSEVRGNPRGRPIKPLPGLRRWPLRRARRHPVRRSPGRRATAPGAPGPRRAGRPGGASSGQTRSRRRRWRRSGGAAVGANRAVDGVAMLQGRDRGRRWGVPDPANGRGGGGDAAAVGAEGRWRPPWVRMSARRCRIPDAATRRGWWWRRPSGLNAARAAAAVGGGSAAARGGVPDPRRLVEAGRGPGGRRG